MPESSEERIPLSSPSVFIDEDYQKSQYDIQTQYFSPATTHFNKSNSMDQPQGSVKPQLRRPEIDPMTAKELSDLLISMGQGIDKLTPDEQLTEMIGQTVIYDTGSHKFNWVANNKVVPITLLMIQANNTAFSLDFGPLPATAMSGFQFQAMVGQSPMSFTNMLMKNINLSFPGATTNVPIYINSTDVHASNITIRAWTSHWYSRGDGLT